MELLKYIGIISILIWILVPIRQFHTKFFLFFLILGLLDFTSLIFFYVIKLNFEIVYFLGTSILLFSFIQTQKKLNDFALLALIVTVSLFIFYYTIISPMIVQTAVHFVIFIFVLRILVIYYSQHRKLLWFHLIMIIYEFSVLLKFFIYHNELEIGLVYYYVTTAFQILIGIFFLFVNEKNSPALKV